ncbi:oligosaccharide flippase family protein [Pedobacter namyangjuensis]|uniref:oligosaccharide flippase family protein n=1 Tax=Pedobacter namyangjuensis TaxID=600626 RepID=UPI000DE23D26|nr:polysaccharide biosynthesis C-terminal domain-containing protein [Pedobacter namyangjuensis]
MTKGGGSFVSNYILYLLTQALNLVTPFIVLPIISKRLGIIGMGDVSYVIAISQVFITIGAAGLLNYGNRKISSSLNVVSDFRLLFSIQIITSILSYAFFLVYIKKFEEQYNHYFFISSIGVLANIFDFSWYFISQNKIKNITIRNLFVKVIMILGILFLVKNREDILVYLYIYFGTTFLLNLLMCGFIHSDHFKIWKIKLQQILQELGKVFIFFIPTMLMLVYASFDKILLAKIVNNESLVIYDNSLKIITILCVLTASLSPLMVARMSKTEEGDIKKLVGFSLSFVCYFSFPMVFGIIAISENLVNVLFDKSFNGMIQSMRILAPIIFFIGLGDIMVNQIIISTNKDRQYIIVMASMVITSLLLNLLLIPIFGVTGASVSNLLSHFLILGVEYYFCRNYINIKLLLTVSFAPFIASIIMMLVIQNLDIFPVQSMNMIIKILVGMAIFVILNHIMKTKFQQEVLSYALLKLKKRNEK